MLMLYWRDRGQAVVFPEQDLELLKGDLWQRQWLGKQAWGRLRNVHQDSATNHLCGPLVWSGTHTKILVEGRLKHGQAFCSLLLLLFISHPALPGRGLGAA